MRVISQEELSKALANLKDSEFFVGLLSALIMDESFFELINDKVLNDLFEILKGARKLIKKPEKRGLVKNCIKSFGRVADQNAEIVIY